MFILPTPLLALLFTSWVPGLQLLEEVVPLVIDKDECREVLNPDFPDGFHAEFGIFHAFDAFDGIHRKHGGRSADAA